MRNSSSASRHLTRFGIVSLAGILFSGVVNAAEVMPNDPVLPENNLPSSQRSNPGAPNNIPVPTTSQSRIEATTGRSNSTETSTGVNVGPGSRIAPRNGSRNGTLTGNGAGVGPEQTAPNSPGSSPVGR